MRTLIMGALLFAALFQPHGETAPAQAQGNGEVKISARVGFDGYCKQDAWLPIHVTVENSGADLSAIVQVSFKNSRGGLTATSTAVTLPSTSRKEFFLYIYPESFLRDFNVSVLDGKKILAKAVLSANCLSADNMLFGVLSDNPAAFDVLNDVKPLTGFARVAQMKLSDLPDKAPALNSLSALIVSNVDTASLSADQKQALTTWLDTGGKLVVTGGLKWQGTLAGLKDFVPLDIQGTRNVSNLSALQAYLQDPDLLETGTVLSVGTIREGADVLVTQDRIPLIVQKQAGFGTVYYLAADPAIQPLSGWNGLKDLFTILLGYRPPLPRWTKGFWYTYSANQALGSIAELGIPSVFYIGCLVGFYVLVIGPIHYFALRRIKRRELAWVTIPALVLIFSCIAYGSGLVYRGTTPILNRLVVAQAWDDADQAHVDALVGVYSPVRANYALEAADHFLIQPFGDNNGDVQASNNWTAVQKDANMILPELRVEIGAMKAVDVEGSISALPISHDMALTINKTNPEISGTIRNQSDSTLRDAILVTPGNWEKLGDLAPGASKPVRVSLGPITSNGAFYTIDPMTILGINYSDIQTDADVARRYALLQTVFASTYQNNDANWGIYLMGWVDKPLLPVSLQNRKSKTIDTMLYIDRLSPSVNIEAGELELPVGLFTWEASAPNVTPYYSYQIPAGGYILRFKPAFPIHYRAIKSMNLVLASNASPSELIPSLWDYTQEAWVEIPGPYYSSIENPERYIGPNGEMKLRIVVNRSDWTEITASYLQLVVEP